MFQFYFTLIINTYILYIFQVGLSGIISHLSQQYFFLCQINLVSNKLLQYIANLKKKYTVISLANYQPYYF